MSAGTHQRLYHTWETDYIRSRLELIIRLGIEVFCRSQSQIECGKITYGTPVHREINGACRWSDLYSSLFVVEQPLRTDRLYLGNNQVGGMKLDHSIKSRTVKHVYHFRLIGHLHRRRIVITVTGNDVLACALCRNGELLSQLAGTQ